jgi:DNA-binding NarL/FixJ family response regulator
MASMTTHLLLIDDHALFRSGVGMVLAAGLGDVEITEAASLEEALACPNEVIDLMLLDLQLGGASGLDGIDLLKRRWPCAKLLVVSATQDPRAHGQALERGANGFISKTETPARMLELVGLVLAGEPPSPAHQPALTGAERSTRLSPRQYEVLELLCLGLPNKLIGRRLNLSENTVRGHVQGILLALQVSSRSEAAFVARRQGLIS